MIDVKISLHRSNSRDSILTNTTGKDGVQGWEM